MRMKSFQNIIFSQVQPVAVAKDRRTDGQTDKVIPVYPPFNFVEGGGV